MEDTKKEKESPELKEELSEDELKDLSGGNGHLQPGNVIGYADETPLSRQQ